jgi:hypothetical protein
MFKSHGTPGFHMTFANGITVSVQWSRSHYRTGRDISVHAAGDNTKSPDAEVALWDDVGDLSVDTMLGFGERIYVSRGHVTSYRGWVSPEDVAIILANAAKA